MDLVHESCLSLIHSLRPVDKAHLLTLISERYDTRKAMSSSSLPRRPYDPRQLFIFPVPAWVHNIKIAHKRTIGVYLSGALVRSPFPLPPSVVSALAI